MAGENDHKGGLLSGNSMSNCYRNGTNRYADQGMKRASEMPSRGRSVYSAQRGFEVQIEHDNEVVWRQR